MDELLFRKTGPGPSVWSLAIRGMGNYGRVALGHLDSDLVILAVTHVSHGWQDIVYVVKLELVLRGNPPGAVRPP
jgi:hypothetical protein